MHKGLDKHFVLTLSSLFVLMAGLACFGLLKAKNADEQYGLFNEANNDEEMRRLLTEITIQRLELNNSFDRYLHSCINKIKANTTDTFDYQRLISFYFMTLNCRIVFILKYVIQ